MPRLRRMLEDHRRFRLDQLADLAAEEVAAARRSEVGHIDDLDASADSARIEVSTVIAAGARRTLDDIDLALARIRSGQYGWCERCHAEIDVQRLMALPQAGLCMECQRREEVAANRG
jgi:DnaK suppressor protein